MAHRWLFVSEIWVFAEFSDICRLLFISTNDKIEAELMNSETHDRALRKENYVGGSIIFKTAWNIPHSGSAPSFGALFCVTAIVVAGAPAPEKEPFGRKGKKQGFVLPELFY